MKRLLLCFILAVSTAAIAPSQSDETHGPDCRGSWPTNMAFVHLENAGLVDSSNTDFSKTKTVRLASERINKDLWHQVYQVTFTLKSGVAIDAIAVHDASQEECSMSGAEVFVVSRHLNPDRK